MIHFNKFNILLLGERLRAKNFGGDGVNSALE